MSSNSKAFNRKTTIDILKELMIDKKKRAGLERHAGTGITGSGSRPIGTSGVQSSPDTITTEFLKKEGDQMIGPIAFSPQVVIVSAGEIDVGNATNTHRGRLIVANEASAATDDLDTILNNGVPGSRFTGQWLNIQTVAGQTLTLKHLTGNFRSGTGADIILPPQSNILLIFDGAEGRWTNLGAPSSSSGTGAAACPQICSENDLGTVSGVVDLDWSIANFHRAVIEGDTTFNIINTPGTGDWQDICLEVQQDALGAHTVNFVQGFANNFIPKVITGAGRYTSWQIYTYEEPSGTDIFQAFDKAGTNGPQVPGGGGQFQGFAGYIQTELSVDQTTNIGINNHIEFDTIVDNDTLVVTVGAGQARGIFSGFRPGHVYSCNVHISGEGTNNTLNFAAKWFDRVGNNFIGSEAEMIAASSISNRDSQPTGHAFFKSTSLADTLEVRITNSTALTSILNGSSSTEPTTFATIKDCGVTEETLNAPEPAPEFGELDIREFIYQECSTNSSLQRFAQFQQNGSFTNLSASLDPIIRNMRIKAVLINVSNKGAGVRTFNLTANGVARGNVFSIPAFFTGIIEFAPVDIGLDKSEGIGWESSGGSSGDRWAMTCVVWYL